MIKKTLIPLLLAPMFIVGCTSLVKPDVVASSEALRGGSFALDESHAALTFKIDHLGFSNYVGRFEAFSASLDLDEATPEAAQLDVIIEMTSLDVANDAFANTLMTDWFDTEQFPTARFIATDVTVTGEAMGTITGNLTLHGVTRPVVLDLQFNGGARDLIRGNAYIVGFSATGRIDRSEFGISNLSGIIANEVAISIEAEFIRQ